MLDPTPQRDLRSALLSVAGLDLLACAISQRIHYAWEWSGGLVGMALGGWVGGLLFDITGAYTWSIVLAATASFATLPFILSLPGRSDRQPIINLAPTPASA